MKLLGAKEVAELLGVSRHAIPGFVRSGMLEFVKLPEKRREYFTRDGVERFIQRCTVNGPGLEVREPENPTLQSSPREQGRARRFGSTGRPHEWRNKYARRTG